MSVTLCVFVYINTGSPVSQAKIPKGDVHVYSREDIQQLCKASGLKLESYEVRKGFRLHCVVRKEEDASL